MRTSSSLSSDCSFPQRGFTLIEILVVLLIVTIMTGLVVTQLPAFAVASDVDRETRRLELLLNMARSEALLDSSEFGFRRTDKGYEFLRFDDASLSWRSADSPFQARRLDDSVRMTLRAQQGEYDLPGEGLPPVLILSSGEMTPFKVILSSPDGQIENIIEADAYGSIEWREDTAE